MGANGSTAVNFGAFPGKGEAEVDVTGQSGYVASSRVEAWVLPIATADHTIDDHVIENIGADARYKVDGTFTVRAFSMNPPQTRPVTKERQFNTAQRALLYGQFTLGWAWT